MPPSEAPKRNSNDHPIGSGCVDGYHEAHEWQPLSFVFETQMLDAEGRVVVRQPAIDDARVYLVCLKCRGYTYVVTNWVGYYLGDPDDVLPDPGGGSVVMPPTPETGGWSREAELRTRLAHAKLPTPEPPTPEEVAELLRSCQFAMKHARSALVAFIPERYIEATTRDFDRLGEVGSMVDAMLDRLPPEPPLSPEREQAIGDLIGTVLAKRAGEATSGDVAAAMDRAFPEGGRRG